MAVEFLGIFGDNLLLTVLILAATAIPLYFAVKLMGGDVGFLEAMLVILIAGGIPIVVGLLANAYVQLLSFIAIIIVYMFFFKLGVGKAILAWLIQYAIIFALLWLFAGMRFGMASLG